jgi:hypothetical protein
MENEPTIVVKAPYKCDSDVEFELRRRGFVVQSSQQDGEFLFVATTMSKKLVVKLSLQEDIPLKPIKKYSAYQSLSLANAAIAVILRASSVGATAAWVAHGKNGTQNLTTISGNEHELTGICNYFGPSIALQFGVIAFNKYHLTAVSVVGLMIFLEQAAAPPGAAQSIWVYAYCLYLALWSSYHLQRWKQRQNSLSYLWGSLGADQEAVDAEVAKVRCVCWPVLLCFCNQSICNHLQ